MECQKCQKERAVVHITDGADIKRQAHYCLPCAAAAGVGVTYGHGSTWRGADAYKNPLPSETSDEYWTRMKTYEKEHGISKTTGPAWPSPKPPEVQKVPHPQDDLAKMLGWLRAKGWMVGVHNDYRCAAGLMTFWLFTHASGRFLKAEGPSDSLAVAAICDQVRTITDEK